jgi:DMSO/TMAO reductase YedYZ molybdopterin-dependent catalytic subunit
MQADHQHLIQNQQTENNSEYQVHQPVKQPMVATCNRLDDTWQSNFTCCCRCFDGWRVLLLRFASEHWQLSLGVKLSFIAIAGIITLLQVICCKRKIDYLLLLYKAWV